MGSIRRLTEQQIRDAVIVKLQQALPELIADAVHSLSAVPTPSRPGTVGAVRGTLDQLALAGEPTVHQILSYATSNGWNPVTTRSVFYGWRRKYRATKLSQEHRISERRVKSVQVKLEHRTKDRRAQK